MRLDDKTTDASTAQIAELAQRKAHLDWLSQPCPGTSVDDVDFFALEQLVRGINLPGGVRQVLEPEFRLFGSADPLTSRIRVSGGDSLALNRFAVLLIGREPERYLPGAFVAVTRFRGVSRAEPIFFSNEFFGPIPKLVEKVMGVLEPETGVITDKTQDPLNGGSNRARYSRKAIFEILVNALAHRDYRDRQSTKIYVFADRIEFESPGGLVGLPGLDAAKQGRTHWRNPSLARYLAALGLAQERGTGLPIAIVETLYLAGNEPVFEVDTRFKVTVPAYRQPSRQQVNPNAGALLVSIGYGTIDPRLVQTTFPELTSEKISAYHHGGVVTPGDWPDLIRDLRDWLRGSIEASNAPELHLFYRGPVAVGPLIGAMAVGRKPLVVHSFDEEAGAYHPAYRVDRRLLQGD